MPAFPNFPHLAAFLMVYIAKSDGQTHFLEETTLVEQLNSFTDDSQGLLKKINLTYPKIQDEKIEAVLKDNESLIRASSNEERLQLIQSLFAIVNSDGRVQSEETGALRVIRGALEGVE